MSTLCIMILFFAETSLAAVIRRAAITSADDSRSWESAVQNINGMNSILTLLPVLTGKVQNIKLVASRIYPASFVVAGIGAGRVLAKLQLGILLWSFDLYRNTITEISYPHDEYVNKFAPPLLHLPTGTAERHSTNVIINHNLAETYMVEAWFRTKGAPSIVELKQNNYERVAAGSAIYIVLYAGETYLAVRNSATGTANFLIIVQAICVGLWLGAVTMVQIIKGQGKREVQLNTLQSSAYRCLTLPTLGDNVKSEIFSFHLNNLSDYRLYGSDYQQRLLSVAGGLILASAALDILSTVLIVGLTSWAYPWIGVEVMILLVKVVFCVEPMRVTEINNISNQGPSTASKNVELLPLKIVLAQPFSCLGVYTDHNIFIEAGTDHRYQSTSAGLWIGQMYTCSITSGTQNSIITKYLVSTTTTTATGAETKLSLTDTAPIALQDNQALQREFLAALRVVADGNRVPSQQFIAALERTLGGVQKTMEVEWFTFGSKDLIESITKAQRGLLWRKWL